VLSNGTVFLIFVAAIIVMQVWLFKAFPPKKITNKYSKTILLLSVIPLVNKWKNAVDPGDDMDAILKYRRAVIRFSLLVVISFFFLCIYLYLK
jgi:hypothetical protein